MTVFHLICPHQPTRERCFFVPPGTSPSLRLFNPSQTPLYVCLPDFGGQPPAQRLHFEFATSQVSIQAGLSVRADNPPRRNRTGPGNNAIEPRLYLFNGEFGRKPCTKRHDRRIHYPHDKRFRYFHRRRYGIQSTFNERLGDKNAQKGCSDNRPDTVNRVMFPLNAVIPD